MKKIVSNYYDVYNFLNIINPRLGKLFKLTRYSPLPEGFVITEQNMTELLLINQIADNQILPPFVGQEKKNIKKMFKNGLKHCKYMIKHHPFEKYCSKEFSTRLLVYFNIRKDLFDLLLKDFNTDTADEVQYYRESFNLNPVLGKAMDVLYDEKVDCDLLFKNLEEKYNLAFQQRIKLLNKKQQKTTEKIQTISENQIQKNIKNSEKLQKTHKKIEKIAKKSQKIEKTKEIQKNKTEKIKKQTDSKKER